MSYAKIKLLLLVTLISSSLQQCGEGCECFFGSCNSCKPGYVSSNAMDGTLNKICIKCAQVGCAYCSNDAKVCYSCNTGFTSGTSSDLRNTSMSVTCQSCGTGCYSCESLNSCFICDKGYNQSGSGCKKVNIGLIIGLSVGGFVLLVIIIISLRCYCQKKMRDQAI